MTTAEIGQRGEDAAVEYLREAGYEIYARNWRNGRYELDIVAFKGEIMHFVEVKTRRKGGLTTPEDAITASKFRALHHAASLYMSLTGGDYEAQFDLAAVDMMPNGSLQVRFTENAMEYNW